MTTLVETKLPSLASLAAQALLQNPKSALKSSKDRSLGQYSTHVSHVTEFDVSRLKSKLSLMDLPESIFVYTTGSDGKLEKANRIESPVELIVLCEDAEKEEVSEKINALVRSGLMPMDERVELKDPKKEPLSICNITNTVIPSRFLHNLPIIGTESQRDALTLQFIPEIQTISGKNRKKFIKKFISVHTKQMNDVISGKDTSDVDLVNGVLSYSGMGRKATKYSLLRPIQYKLDLVLLDAIRTRQANPEEYAELIKNMPRPVPDQIQYMYEQGLLPHLSPQDVIDLKQAYTLGLFYFQTAQHLVSNIDSFAVTFDIPDPAELTKAYIDAERILRKI